MRVEVFAGWIELRDPELVPERLRRPVVAQSVKAAQFSDIDLESDDVDIEEATRALDFFSDLNDHLAMALIEAWSFAEPITIDGLLNLGGKTYDSIRKEVAPFVAKLMPDFGATEDPKALTETLND